MILWKKLQHRPQRKQEIFQLTEKTNKVLKEVAEYIEEKSENVIKEDR